MSILSKWYEKDNFSKVYYSGFSGWVSKQFHELLEHERSAPTNVLLEVGATHGQHFSYVKHPYGRYILSDLIVSPELKAFISHPNVSVMQIDVTDMSQIKSDEIDRLISTCLLHHLNDITPALSEIGRVLSDGGIADILVPNDPSLLWNLGRSLLTFPRAKLNGWTWKQYWEYVHADHLNSIREIDKDVKNFCKLHSLTLTKKKFPFQFLPNFLTAYFRFTIEKTATSRFS
jgi:SAM-dependent methyltransferase